LCFQQLAPSSTPWRITSRAEHDEQCVADALFKATARAFFAEQFKIPTLWGVKDTAPYFHDNGAKTLRDAVAHYQRFFNFPCDVDPVGSCSLGGFIVLTDNDVDDIVAYLKLLGLSRTDE
jgi:cytochrome c peroxidase